LTDDDLDIERAHRLCDAVKDARGKTSGTQLEADVKAKVGGLLGNLVDVGGGTKATISREQFEGLTREATAAALENDRDCRERIFKLLGQRRALQSSPQPKVSPAEVNTTPLVLQVHSTPEVKLRSPFEVRR
jgi:hypothetical protein